MEEYGDPPPHSVYVQTKWICALKPKPSDTCSGLRFCLRPWGIWRWTLFARGCWGTYFFLWPNRDLPTHNSRAKQKVLDAMGEFQMARVFQALAKRAETRLKGKKMSYFLRGTPYQVSPCGGKDRPWARKEKTTVPRLTPTQQVVTGRTSWTLWDLVSTTVKISKKFPAFKSL